MMGDGKGHVEQNNMSESFRIMSYLFHRHRTPTLSREQSRPLPEHFKKEKQVNKGGEKVWGTGTNMLKKQHIRVVQNHFLPFSSAQNHYVPLVGYCHAPLPEYFKKETN